MPATPKNESCSTPSRGGDREDSHLLKQMERWKPHHDELYGVTCPARFSPSVGSRAFFAALERVAGSRAHRPPRGPGLSSLSEASWGSPKLMRDEPALHANDEANPGLFSFASLAVVLYRIRVVTRTKADHQADFNSMRGARRLFPA
jgi:hypothetical protein